MKLMCLPVCRLCPNATGADIRSVCTEAGMFAIRARRKTVTEKDFLDAVQKVRLEQSCVAPCQLMLCLPTTQAQMGICSNLRPSACLQVIKGYQKFSATPKYMVYN